MTLTIIVWILCGIATPFVALLEADREEKTIVNRVLLLVAGLIFGPFALLGALFKWRDNSLVKLKRLAGIHPIEFGPVPFVAIGDASPGRGKMFDVRRS